MTDLQNKTAIITGSSKGLGKQTALQLAQNGANVVVNYNSNQAEAEATVQQIISSGGKAIAVKADVSQSQDIAYLFNQTIEHFGQVDIVINNAGIMITKPLKHFTDEEFDRQFANNVKSVFAKEIGSRGITVNAVLPGPMNTELFTKGKSEEMISRIASLSAFNRIGEVEDIVPMILFLCSEQSQWITGQNIGANGGMA